MAKDDRIYSYQDAMQLSGEVNNNWAKLEFVLITGVAASLKLPVGRVYALLHGNTNIRSKAEMFVNVAAGLVADETLVEDARRLKDAIIRAHPFRNKIVHSQIGCVTTKPGYLAVLRLDPRSIDAIFIREDIRVEDVKKHIKAVGVATFELGIFSLRAYQSDRIVSKNRGNRNPIDAAIFASSDDIAHTNELVQKAQETLTEKERILFLDLIKAANGNVIL